MLNRIFRQKISPKLIAMSSDVGALRFLSVVAQPTLLAFVVFLDGNVKDSMPLRLAIAGTFLLAALLSYFSGWVRKNAAVITQVLLTEISVWSIGLALANEFDAIFVVSSVTLVLFGGLFFKDFRGFSVYAIVCAFTVCIGFYLYPDLLLQQFVYLGVLLMVIVISFLGLSFKLSIERELRRTNDLLNSILQNSPDAILVLSLRSMRVIQFNPNAERLAGIPGNHELLMKYWQPILVGIQTEMTTGMAFLRKTSQIQRSDQSSFWAEILLTEIHAGGRKLLLCTIADITNRITAEQSLGLASHILKEVDHLAVVCNENAEVIYLSPAVERVLGYSNQELLGNGWWEAPLRPKAEHEAEKQYLRLVLRGKSTLRAGSYEAAYRTKQGNEVWVQWKDAVTKENQLIAMGVEHTEERKSALLKSVIFNIAEASSKVKSPGEFYEFIHKEIRRVINTPNFYIAVYDQVKDIVYFPYYADAADTKLPFSRKAGQGLTELTIRSKKPLLASKADILELDRIGKVQLGGQSIPEVWLGVPMLHDEEVVGLITIQDYETPSAYTSDDLELISFIAGQVAQFVSKLQADESLRISEERFRAIYDYSAVGIAQITLSSRFLSVNQRICDIFGYTEEEITKMSPMDITYSEDLHIGKEELEDIRNGVRNAYSVEKRYVHKAGHIVNARVNVSAYREEGKIKFIISVYEDITERVRAQEEISMLFSLSNALNVSNSNEAAVAETLEHVLQQGTWEYGEAWLANEAQQVSFRELRCSKLMEGKPSPAVPAKAEFPNSDEIFWLEESDLASAEFSRAQSFQECGYRTVAIMPVFVEGKLFAAILLAANRNWEASERNLRVLSAARAQLQTFMLRKQAENAQKESESRYKAITEAAFEGIAIHRMGNVLHGNNAFAQLFGIEVQQVPGISLLDLAAEEEGREKLQGVMLGEGSVNITGLKRDGSHVELEAVCRKGTWEGLPAGIIAMRDITNEKLMDAARETARLDARFRAYVQNSTEIILILDNGLCIQYASPTLERTTGLESEYVVATEFQRILHPADVNLAKSLLKEVLQHAGASEKAGMRIATEDGEWRHFQMAFTNLLHDPMVKGILVSAHDITDLKRTEAAVLENEIKFRSIFSQANDAILVLEARRIVECNDMAEEMFALPRELLIGTSLVELSPEFQPDGSDSRLKLYEKMGDALDGNYQYFTWRHRRGTGERFDAEISMSQIRIGETVSVQCVVRDITERVQAENALRESERRNKAILDAIPDLMLRVNDQGEVLDYKAADQQALILESDFVIGSNIRDLLPDIVTENVFQTAQLDMQAGEGRQYENELIVGDSSRDFETRVVRSGNHELLVIIRDVTERKRTEKELIKRNFELDSFVYRASHDLKAPLNSLMGLISIMNAEFEEESIQNYLRMMNKSVVKLDSFIRDLGDFSRNNRGEIEPSNINWESTIAESLENLRFMETAERVTHSVEVSSKGEFHSDPVLLGIVVNNLISNAIKYQNLKRNDAFVRIEVQSDSERAIFKVTDNGIGMSEEHLAKIFNLFFRASVQSYGSGMGMYIVKNAVDRLKGTIKVESRLQEGSTFTLSLPNIKQES